MSRIVALGGSGYVGRSLVAKLVDDGHRVIVPTRRRERARDLILLPTVEVVEADVHDRRALASVARNADAMVNLVGILNPSGSETFARAHVELARNVVEACRTAGVPRLLHMSALQADTNGPSAYLRSKGEAEAIVASSGLAWTIFRPSVIFGPDDAFLNLFAHLLKLLPVVALAAPNARFQPVYVGDVAECFRRSVALRDTIGERYELCGPKVYTLRELVRFVGEVTGRVRPIIPLGPGLSRLQAGLLEMLPGTLMSRDNLRSMERDSVCAGPFPPVFGIVPQALEATAPAWLAPDAMRDRYVEYRAHGGR